MRTAKERYANLIINTLLILYPLCLITYIIWCLIINRPYDLSPDQILETIFHVVEIFFVAPIPIFILTGLQKYLRNIAFLNNDVDNRVRVASLTQSILETNLTKHNFISVILSTFFIGLIEKVVISKNAHSEFENSPYYILAIGVTIIGMVLLFFYLKSSKHNITQLISEANKANELSMTTDLEKREAAVKRTNEIVTQKIATLNEFQMDQEQFEKKIAELEQKKQELLIEIEAIEKKRDE